MATSMINRISSVAFGSGLILATMTISTAPLGGFAVLPLIAVPMILFGLFGENPIGELTAGPVNIFKAQTARFISKLTRRNTKRNAVTA